MKFKICSLLIATGVVFCIDQNSETSTVNIEGLGLVRGSISHTAWSKRKVFKFQGLHYGVAPVENLRFQPTVKVAPWDGVRNATEPGVRCPQITKGYVNVDDEDCLTLSVFTNEVSLLKSFVDFNV